MTARFLPLCHSNQLQQRLVITEHATRSYTGAKANGSVDPYISTQFISDGVMTQYAYQESNAYDMLFDYIVIENYEKVVRLSEMAQLVVKYQPGHWDKGM